MKTRSLFRLLFIFFLTPLLLTSCIDDLCNQTQSYIRMEPVYVETSEYRVDPIFLNEREMENPGKFYFYNQLILINEIREGIHFLDNSDPSQPKYLGFLKIPGNLDMAIKDKVMYADNFSDLVTVDISDLQQPKLLCREEGIFENNYFPDVNRVISHYETTSIIEEVNCTNPHFGEAQFQEGGSLFIDANISSDQSAGLSNYNGVPVRSGSGSGSNIPQQGIGGSMARFTLAADHLYVINDRELIAFDVQEASKPTKTQTTDVARGIETVFPYGEHLFIGANDGMYIYSLANPQMPQYVSQFRHAQACDPVFVQGDVAFVTLRDGTNCQNFINQLDVVDISDIRNPKLIKTYPMEHPHGLSVRDSELYLCEGAHGLKVFDVSDLNSIDDRQLDHVKGMHAFDAISLSTAHLLVIGEDGLYQFDSDEPSQLKQISYYGVE